MDLRPDVELHIDELVLEGVPARDRAAVAEALRAELGRMIGENGLPPALSAPRETPDTAARVLQTRGTGGPEALGRSLARQILGGG